MEKLLVDPEEGPAQPDVAARLEEEIALGLLRPRERLVEDDLMTRFGVKRHIIRQALVDLEAMGIVTRQPNKGAAVRDFRPQEVRELYEVRELVERRAAELIPLPGDAAFVAALRDIHQRYSEAVNSGVLRTVFRENLRFHRAMFAACGNTALVEVIEQFAQRTHAIRSYTIGDSVLLERVCAEHSAMIEAIEKGERTKLVDLVTSHIQPAKTAYLRFVRD
jgi:DNA-binding GntR family transcriptional regulator